MTNLCINGFATTTTTTDGTVLRLTSAAPCCQSGSTWYAAKQTLANGFQTIFKFRISNPGVDRADGFTFAIQTQSQVVTASDGCGIGYDSMPKSLVIEFDTFANPPFCADTNDPNGNHIAIHTNGTGANSRIHRTTPLPPDWGILEDGNVLDNGNAHVARIIYVPAIPGVTGSGVLRIFVDDFPVYSQQKDLSPILTSNQAWVGFTAGTGTTTANHDIIYWYFKPVTSSTTVTSSADNGAGSLRQVIANASTRSLITFAPNVTNIALATPIVINNQDVTIDGGGIQVPKTSGDEGQIFNRTITCSPCSHQAFQITGTSTVYMGGLIISGFSPLNNGGAIFNNADLILTNTILQFNKSNLGGDPNNQGRGGAIFNDGYLVIDASTFATNTSYFGGGAIYNRSGTVVIRSSTLYNNKANELSSTAAGLIGGGAIADTSFAQSISIYSSTFDSNNTKFLGGAIYTNALHNPNDPQPIIQNSTLTKNYILSSSGDGAAIYASAGQGSTPILVNNTFAYNRALQGITTQGALFADQIYSENSIFTNSGFVDANGNVVSGTSKNCVGALTGIDGGSNLDSDNTCNLSANNNSWSGVNPNVFPDIAANGGLTKTLALHSNSQAIDRGDTPTCNASIILYDQRGPGYPRTVTICDIGAFEYRPNLDQP